MKLYIRHTTRYSYSEPLLYTVQALHLWPVSSVCQTVEHWFIQAPAALTIQPDDQGNKQHSYSLVATPEQNMRSSTVDVNGSVDTHGVAEFLDNGWLPHPMFYLRSTPLAEPSPRLAAWAAEVAPGLVQGLAQGRAPAIEELVALSAAVAERVQYRQGSTGVETTAIEAFDWRRGVCQDQAHVMLAVCRSIGVPARYVSGYFYADTEPDLAGHAWVDVCLDAGQRRWISIDVTHACTTDERHVRLAAATDYTACPPIKGLRRGGGEESMEVTVRIAPVP